MKKKRIWVLSILVIGLVILTLLEEHQWFGKDREIVFRGVGSYISGDDAAYVFYVSDTSWSEIQKHGESLEYNEGSVVASFYYLEKSNAPDLSFAKNYMDALDKGQNLECVAAYWNNGEPRLIKFPGRNWEVRE